MNTTAHKRWYFVEGILGVPSVMGRRSLLSTWQRLARRVRRSMYFEVPLTRDRVARVDCAIERLDPHIVRCALGDNNISVPGTFIICFGVKEAGKVLKPEAIPVSSIKSVTRSPMGLIALQLDDDRMVIPTVPRDYHPAIVESLLRLAQQTPEKPRRLFFARVNEELLLIDANEVCKLPKKLDERPSRPSAAPDEAS